MRLAVWASMAVVVVAGCDGGLGLQRCDSDGDCSEGRDCVDGACAPAFEDGLGEPEPEAGPVRVFAVGLRVRLDVLETQQAFRDAVRAKVDAEVAPALAGDRPNLLVFPENTGLTAALIGERGATARGREQSTDAFGDLLGAYGEAASLYVGRAGGLLPPGRLVTLSVTDTLWRSIDTTFRAMAEELGVYVAVTYDVADAETTTDPEMIDVLVDESVTDPSRAWVATSTEVHLALAGRRQLARRLDRPPRPGTGLRRARSPAAPE